MFRFTLRELLLITAIAATSIAWRVENRAADLAKSTLMRTRTHAERLRESLALAEGECNRLVHWITNGPKPDCPTRPHPEWELVNEPVS
jgi:hypothetical protein